MRRRSKPKTLRAKYERILEKLQREIVIKRDGGCVLRGVYQHTCDDVLQADHLISRSKKSIFFNLKNLNCVCRTVNSVKGKHWHGWEKIQRELERITNNRYGEFTVEQLEIMGKSAHKPDIIWLEKKILEYKKELGKNV